MSRRIGHPKGAKMTDCTAGTCPVCGGRLCVDTEEPDRVYCDTCSYPEEESPLASCAYSTCSLTKKEKQT